MDDWRKNYAASSAPLPAGNLVISGVTGGEHGANGFVIAFDQETGKEVWRFWTVPKPGEPGSETWKGKDIDHGGAPTWFTGSYDPELDLVYWPTGNPGKEYNGNDRQGDNLYASCILALDRKTGTLKWHYQFTPHDLWDWDATQTSVLDRRRLARPAAQADAARRPQRLLLRLRSRDRRAAAVDAVREAPHLGQRHRRRRAADPSAEPGAVGRRHQGVPVAGRRHQLVLAVVQPADRAVLRPDVREVQHLHEGAAGPLGAGQAVSGRLAARPAGGSDAAADPARDRHPHRRDRVGAAAAGPGDLVGRHAGDGDRARVRRPRTAAR